MKRLLTLLLLSFALFTSSCTSNYEGNASSLMPAASEVDSKFTLGGEGDISPFDGLGTKENSYFEKVYSDSEVDYHSISFRVLVYDKRDDAQFMYYVFSQLLKKSEDIPVIEDVERAALQKADRSTVLYSIDTGGSDNYFRVWLYFSKNNVVGSSYTGGTAAKDDTNEALERYIKEAAQYAEIILSKIP
jgi:hypothetical protein